VPVVLKKENVKTLKNEIFARIDKLGAPRLVEYWEVDPCFVQPPMEMMLAKGGGGLSHSFGIPGGGFGVKVEAQFSVGEYDIVVLSAKDALGLESWLTQEKYKIPEGSAALFRPYIQQGMKFFVAKVNAKKVTFDKGPGADGVGRGNGMAALSPLRFHYDSEKFELPIRLGLINAKEKQDLIVHILARNQRFEVANYPNVTIPTNIDLVPSAKSEFPFFYVSLFDRTLKANPKAVITEYAWQASSCDPCPTSPLSEEDFQTLGADVVPSKGVVKDQFDPTQGYVLTRLHARYDKTSLGEDLVFRAAKPIVGGREFLTDGTSLEQGSKPDSINNFQARYAIRYPWTGPVKCKEPFYGRWGGPPANKLAEGVKAAQGTAFVERDPTKVEKLAESSIAELQVKGLKAEAGKPLRKK
jgi:hypothetical protein